MDRPLLETVDLVTRWDPEAGTVSLMSFSPGPAGTSMIPFRNAEIDFDAADFGQFSSLTLAGVEALDDLDAHLPLLEHLLDPARIAQIRAALPDCVDRPRQLQAVRTLPDLVDDLELRPEGVRWGRLALALDQSDSPGLLEPERDLQVLEASLVAADLGLLDLVEGLQSRGSQALERMAALPFGELERLASSTAGAVEEVLRAVLARFGTGRERRLETALGLLSPLGRTFDVEPYRYEVGALASPSPDDDADIVRLDEPATAFLDGLRSRFEDLHSLNVVTLGPDLMVTRTSGDEYIGVLTSHGRRSDGWWLRAFAGDERAALAIAPFLQTPGGDAEARLLLPPSVHGVVRWDIVDDPAERRLSPGMSSYVSAFAFGKAAARHERLGEANASMELWYACGGLHAEAGDQTRSTEARQRVVSTRRFVRAPFSRESGFVVVAPLATDHVLPRRRSAGPRKGPPRR